MVDRRATLNNCPDVSLEVDEPQILGKTADIERPDA
jgi:hypothetical protein